MQNGSEIIIGRPQYLEQLKKWKNQPDLIKIITGVRRCGKSKLFYLYQMDLLVHKEADYSQIININLEDRLMTREIGLTLAANNRLSGTDALLDYIVKKLNPEKMNYVFLDEIQLLDDWQVVANTLRLRDNIDVYLTGSNAYMFSSDLANQLGGRYIEIKMQPLSFREYFDAYPMFAQHYVRTRKEIESLHHPVYLYSHYIKEGGFPQTLSLVYDKQLINDYLMDTVYLNTIQKDVVRRFGIADGNKLEGVVRYLFDNIGNETSIRGIERGLKSTGFSVSVPTISQYIQGLEDSYLLYKCEPFDIKGKQLLETNAKYYVADIGLRTALLGKEGADSGHILENVVYLELIRRGYKVSLGKVYSKGRLVEVDFVATKSGGIVEYYQVSLSVQDTQTLERELEPLQAIDDNFPKFLLTMDYDESDNKGIKHINALKWLLDFD